MSLNPESWHAIWLTARLIVSVLPAYVLGAAIFGWLLVYGLKHPGWLDALVTMPIVFPPVILGFGLLWVLGNESPFGASVRQFGRDVVFHFPGLWLAAFIAGIPFATKSLQSALQAQPRELHETAMTLGCRPWTAYWRVHLPIALPGLMAGVTLAVARGLGEVGMSLMLGGNIIGGTETLSLAIYNAAMTDGMNQALTLSALLAVASTVIFLVLRWTQQRIWIGRRV